MSAILSLILPYLLPTVASALGTVLTALIARWLAKLAAKTTDQHKLELLSALQDAAEAAVHATEQTVVDQLRARGEWGKPEAYAEALEAALGTLKSQARVALPGLAKLGVSVGEDQLRQLIEAAIKRAEVAQAA